MKKDKHAREKLNMTMLKRTILNKYNSEQEHLERTILEMKRNNSEKETSGKTDNSEKIIQKKDNSRKERSELLKFWKGTSEKRQI